MEFRPHGTEMTNKIEVDESKQTHSIESKSKKWKRQRVLTKQAHKEGEVMLMWFVFIMQAGWLPWRFWPQ